MVNPVILRAPAITALIVSFLFLIPSFPSGWEVATSIVAVGITSLPDTIYLSDCKPYNVNGVAFANAPPSSECSTGTSNWQIDFDSKNFGLPSLFIETTQPRHTNFQGEQTSNEIVVESRTVTRQRDTYFLDYHVFMFDFRIRTVADSVKKECSSIGQGCSFDHETSAVGPDLPPFLDKGTDRTYSNDGTALDGSSLVAFFINPWQGARVAPENTIRFGQWAGIMQAIVFEAEAEMDPKLSQDSPGHAIAVLGRNAAANMWTLNGTQLPSFEFGTVSLDSRIPQLVLVELPYKLFPGADLSKNVFGGITDIVPVNGNIHYIVRMDVLLVTGWQPQLDYIDANNNGVRDPDEFAFIDKNNDNLWTPSIDEVVEGTPPAPPPPPGPEPCAEGFGRAADRNCYLLSVDGPPTAPEDPPQTGSKLESLGPVPDIQFPAPCEFWNLSCFLNTAISFPTLSNWLNLLVMIGVIVAIALALGIALPFLRRRR